MFFLVTYKADSETVVFDNANNTATICIVCYTASYSDTN